MPTKNLVRPISPDIVSAASAYRLRLRPLDRLFGVGLSRVWPKWRAVAKLFQPDTVITWHQHSFAEFERFGALILGDGEGLLEAGLVV